MPVLLITNNIIMTYKALHSMKTRKKGKKENMTIKLDISKAYDRVEWSYMKNMMRKFGFNEDWISKIMTYVTMISYAMLING